MIEVSLPTLALLSSAMDIAGDGGIDPFTPEQRKRVAEELEPHRDLINTYLRKAREQEGQERLFTEEPRLPEEGRGENPKMVYTGSMPDGRLVFTPEDALCECRRVCRKTPHKVCRLTS